MGYVLLALASLIFGLQSDLCPNNNFCVRELGGYSWFLYGAFFYAAIGLLSNKFKQNKFIKGILVVYVIFHANLISMEYSQTQQICYICYAFLIVATSLAVVYWQTPQAREMRRFSALNVGLVFVMVFVILLTVNPTTTNNISNALQTEIQPAQSEQQKLKDISPEYSKLNVTLPNGQPHHIDMYKTPVLYIAPWCEHCNDVLRFISYVSAENRPYIVVTYFEEKDLPGIKQKLSINGLDEELFCLCDRPLDCIQGLPALAIWDEGYVNTIVGVNDIADYLKPLSNIIEIGTAELSNTKDDSGHNAILAARITSDVILYPGEIYSFNEIVGIRTPSRGFLDGQTVFVTEEGPKYVPGIGGGICKTATAIHHAVLAAGLEVVERHDHSLPVSYSETGKDAAVVYGSLDYKFRNNTDSPVRLVVDANSTKISVKILKYQARED